MKGDLPIKKRTFIVLMIMALITSLCFTACGSKEEMTLEKFCADNPEVQESIDQAMADSNVLVEIKENAIIYTFDLSKMDGYTEEIAKSDVVKENLTTALDAAAGKFGNISKSVEESTEIQGISTVVNYNWIDENIVTRTFTSADAG